MGGKLLNGIKNIHVNTIACVRVNGGESKCFRINSGVRQECIMPLWLFNVYMDAMMKEVKMEMEKERTEISREGREWRLSCLFYADDLVLCGESEEDLRVMVGLFFGCGRFEV